MADRACRNFQPNVFNKNKCQNCYKLQDAHRSSQNSMERIPKSQSSQPKLSGGAHNLSSSKTSSTKNFVKSGLLSVLITDSRDQARTQENKWNRRWVVLNSTGIIDLFVYDELHSSGSETCVRSINLDDCTNMFLAEVDTGDPLSHGLNTPDATFYFKADDRMDIDNWVRVFKPFVQAATSYPFRRGSRNSVGSLDAIDRTAPSTTSLHRGHSFGKGSSQRRPTTPPRSSSNYARGRYGSADAIDKQPSNETVKLQLEKLQEDSKLYKESEATSSSKQREAMHILEQELKTKSNKVKELEMEHSKCKDFQKAIIFQEQELQDSRYTIKELRQQLEEAEKKAKQQKAKLSIHTKELAEAKADLDEANSIISIHKANIESLKSELTTMKQGVTERNGKVILTDEEPESDRVFSFEPNADNVDKKDIEGKLKFLVQKLKQNERELLIKTRELEKANESRSKVAKYTRSLLQELEAKLSNNERKLAETEHQLNNSTIELEYEQEKRAKLETDNEKLRDELERLQDLNKKSRLPGEALALIQDATKEKNPALDELKEQLAESEKQLRLMERQLTSTKNDFASELAMLTSKLKSSEALADKNETKYKECKAELQIAREKSLEVRRVSLETENDSKLHQVVIAKDSELQTARDSIGKLETEISLLNEKNEELEEQFDSMDEKLCQSLEKQFSLSEENEKLLKDKKILNSRVRSLLDEVADLKLALSDTVDEANTESGKQRMHELQDDLNEKRKDLKSAQSMLKEKEQELEYLKMQYETSMKNSVKVDEEREKVIDLENKIELLQNTMEEKLQEKDNDINSLKNEKEKLEQELILLKALEEEQSIDSNRVEDLEQQVRQYELFLSTAKDTIVVYETKINTLSSHKDELEKSNQELKKRTSSLEHELEVYQEKLRGAEERLLDYEVEEKLLNAELLKCKRDAALQESQISATSVDVVESDPNKLEEEKDNFQKLLDEKENELINSENKVLELAEELDKRLSLEQETAEWIEDVEASLNKTEGQLVKARRMLLEKSQELEREKSNILDLVELSRKYVRELELSLATEKSKVEQLQAALNELKKEEPCNEAPEYFKDSPDGSRLYQGDSVKALDEKLSSCERERDSHKARADALMKELEDTKQQLEEKLDSAEKAHQKDLKKMNEETLQVSGAAKTEGDELRLRLTSRVITLQSDISELKAAHQTDIEKLKARHKKEIEHARREAILEHSMKQSFSEADEDLNASMAEMENEMKNLVSRYETQMEVLKQNHQREMDRLKRSSDHGEGLKTEVTQLQAEMENMSQKYLEEIEMLKNKHAEELDQLKTDMSLVVQASSSSNTSPTKELTDGSQQLKARIKELESEIEELSQKYNEELRVERESQQKELDQIRDDMMTVIQAVKSQQYNLDPDTEQLQRTVREQEDEIKRLKDGVDGGLDNAEVEKIKEENRQLEQEKTEIEKSLKRQEAATMFGLRRTEEMSNKIYQMQKEMEDIDRKYMKEINMYKEAYEREKEKKTSSGEEDVDDLRDENEDLRLEIEELRLKMEEDATLHENELSIYKEKLGQEKLLDVEHLMMKIKGLEDSIEEIRLEHQREIEELQESHCENVKNLNSEHKKELQNLKEETQSTSSVTKIKTSRVDEEHKEKVRTLEFKIEELESLLEVKKRRHKEEVRSLKERLDEEMQRHSQDVRNYETKLRECDVTRRPSISSGPGANEYYRKQLSEVRSENRTLRDEMETLKSELVTLRSSKAGSSNSTTRSTGSTDKPLKDTQRLASESDLQTKRKSSLDHKETLRKTVSDTKTTEMSKRPFRVSSTTLDKRNDTTENKSKLFTRQSSKTDVKKSVAERVAMFQTPSKNDNSTRIR